MGMGKTIAEVAAAARERGMTYGQYVSQTEPPEGPEAWTLRAKAKASPAPAEPEKRHCPVCGKKFYDTRKNIKYCSPQCRDIARSRCVIDYRKRHGIR